MAIEKTVFSGQNKETRGAEIVAWLTANGSEFFDSCRAVKRLQLC